MAAQAAAASPAANLRYTEQAGHDSFKASLHLRGLEMTEAASHFDVSRPTVASWGAVRASVPPAARAMLSQFLQDMVIAENLAITLRDSEDDPLLGGSGVRGDTFATTPAKQRKPRGRRRS